MALNDPQICMTCRLRCNCCCCCSDNKERLEVKSGLEITRLDLLPHNFVESHFGNLIKAKHGPGFHPRENASVKRSIRSHEPIIDPTAAVENPSDDKGKHFDFIFEFEMYQQSDIGHLSANSLIRCRLRYRGFEFHKCLQSE